MNKQKSTEKKLTQREQLEQDVAKFDQQIESMRNQLMQLIGAKTYASQLLKVLTKPDEKQKDKS